VKPQILLPDGQHYSRADSGGEHGPGEILSPIAHCSNLVNYEVAAFFFSQCRFA
jgi:hypothetical protein